MAGAKAGVKPKAPRGKAIKTRFLEHAQKLQLFTTKTLADSIESPISTDRRKHLTDLVSENKLFVLNLKGVKKLSRGQHLNIYAHPDSAQILNLVEITAFGRLARSWDLIVALAKGIRINKSKSTSMYNGTPIFLNTPEKKKFQDLNLIKIGKIFVTASNWLKKNKELVIKLDSMLELKRNFGRSGR